jgi:hypothetical protein
MKIGIFERKIFLFAICIGLLSVDFIQSERMETIASFKSNYKLMNSELKNRKAMGDPASSASATTPAGSSSVAGAAKSSDKSATGSSQIKQKSDDLPDVPIYYQGWVKYFHYKDGGQDRPKKFYKNEAFAKQSQAGNLKKDTPDKDEVKILI